MRTSRTSSFFVLVGFLVAGAPALLSGQVADPDATRFADAMDTFAAYDAKNSFPADATVFVGSSSIVLWDTGDRFHGMPLINRGFGGSQMSDLVHYVQETVLKYAPRTVVVYEGDNDTSAGKRSQQILEDYQEFVEAVLKAQPSTRIVILSIKPSLSRWDVWRDDEAVIFECEANGFLKHQIRRANGLLLEVGKGRRPACVVNEVLAGKCPDPMEWQSIPAHGLCLMKVTYPEFPPHLGTMTRVEARSEHAGAAAEKT